MTILNEIPENAGFFGVQSRELEHGMMIPMRYTGYIGSRVERKHPYRILMGQNCFGSGNGFANHRKTLEGCFNFCKKTGFKVIRFETQADLLNWIAVGK